MNLPKIATKDSNLTLKAFISNFVSEEFFIDLINITLYPSQFSSMTVQGNSIIDQCKKFLIDLSKSCDTLKLDNSQKIKNYITIVTTLLTIRESGSSIINYDNVFQHITSTDLSVQQLIKTVINNKINDSQDFRTKIEDIINKISAYYEVYSIGTGLTAFDNFAKFASQPNISVFEAIKNYKDSVIQLYNDLTKLQTLNKYEKEKDYYMISDKNSIKVLAEDIVKHIKKDYGFFKSGYNLFDKYLTGFESSSVIVISAPSNHGKSLFLSGMARNIIKYNLNDFKENDTILFLTLEDDKFRLTRRFWSIFGNYKQQSIKKSFRLAFESFKALNIIDQETSLDANLKKIYHNVLENSIFKTTQGKVNLIVQHCNENEFSAADLSKFIDRLRVDGINIKIVFLDYIDTMSPSVSRFQNAKDYEIQGQITQELRLLSRYQKIPIITATQNKRESENKNSEMNNSMVGDSYKKVRYSDYIFMCKLHNGRNPLDPDIRAYTFNKNNYSAPDVPTPEILKLKDQICSDLIPFEVKITKTKDDGKDQMVFMLFCKNNLRIYNNIQEYLDDLKEYAKNTSDLEKDIALMMDMSISSVSNDFNDDDNYQLKPFEDPQNFEQNISSDIPDFLN